MHGEHVQVSPDATRLTIPVNRGEGVRSYFRREDEPFAQSAVSGIDANVYLKSNRLTDTLVLRSIQYCQPPLPLSNWHAHYAARNKLRESLGVVFVEEIGISVSENHRWV